VTIKESSIRAAVRALAFLRRVTEHVREQQVHRLLSSRQLVFDRLHEIPNRLQLMTNQMRLLLELVDDYWSGSYRKVPWYSLAVAVAATLYFVSPTDFIPDYLPAIGHVDDLLLIGLAIRLLKRDLIAYAEHKGLDPSDYFRSPGKPPREPTRLSPGGNGASSQND
jgi:uncharacterized membrane protein YkvA (DUF1232 family)